MVAVSCPVAGRGGQSVSSRRASRTVCFNKLRIEQSPLQCSYMLHTDFRPRVSLVFIVILKTDIP